MRSHTTLAAGALLATAALTAATGLTGAAVAARPTAKAATLTITVTSTKGSTTMSSTSFAPGKTLFDIHGKGDLDIISLKPGYTIGDLYKDGKKLFSGDVKVVRRVDKKVVFWGGVSGSAQGEQVGIDLPAGSYYAVNLDRGNEVAFTVTGAPEVRDLPSPDGTIKMVQEMTFQAPNQLPNKGWIKVQNNASEPHFLVLSKVKPGTTRQQIGSFLMNGAQGNPSWGLPEFHQASEVSPGHSYVFYLHATKGEYAELCFWPSKETGVPHSLMGMFDISQLS